MNGLSPDVAVGIADGATVEDGGGAGGPEGAPDGYAPDGYALDGYAPDIPPLM